MKLGMNVYDSTRPLIRGLLCVLAGERAYVRCEGRLRQVKRENLRRVMQEPRQITRDARKAEMLGLTYLQYQAEMAR